MRVARYLPDLALYPLERSSLKAFMLVLWISLSVMISAFVRIERFVFFSMIGRGFMSEDVARCFSSFTYVFGKSSTEAGMQRNFVDLSIPRRFDEWLVYVMDEPSKSAICGARDAFVDKG